MSGGGGGSSTITVERSPYEDELVAMATELYDSYKMWRHNNAKGVNMLPGMRSQQTYRSAAGLGASQAIGQVAPQVAGMLPGLAANGNVSAGSGRAATTMARGATGVGVAAGLGGAQGTNQQVAKYLSGLSDLAETSQGMPAFAIDVMGKSAAIDNDFRMAQAQAQAQARAQQSSSMSGLFGTLLGAGATLATGGLGAPAWAALAAGGAASGLGSFLTR